MRRHSLIGLLAAAVVLPGSLVGLATAQAAPSSAHVTVAQDCPVIVQPGCDPEPECPTTPPECDPEPEPECPVPSPTRTTLPSRPQPSRTTRPAPQPTRTSVPSRPQPSRTTIRP